MMTLIACCTMYYLSHLATKCEFCTMKFSYFVQLPLPTGYKD